MTAMLDHALLTRFNMPSRGVESLIRAQDGWLRDRVALFERYTVPSVRWQDTDHFHWLVYLDSASPEWLRERLAPYVEEGLFTPLYRESVAPAEVLEDLRSILPAPAAELVTTNLDNDDAISADFVRRLQEAETAGPRTALYLSEGLILSPSGLYRHRDPTNAFCSVRESWSAPVTCWSDWHNLLPAQMPAVQVGGRPSWLQVVHGTNVSNRTRGRRVRPSAYRASFGDLVAEAAEPSSTALLRDLVVDRPWRWARDTGRVALKGLVLRVGGKRGLDRLKLLGRRLSHPRSASGPAGPTVRSR